MIYQSIILMSEWGVLIGKEGVEAKKIIETADKTL